ncbi:MAG: hypothetical protein AAFY28_07540 [Actinomycetota bacterium]
MTERDAKATTVWIIRAVAYVVYAFFIVSLLILLQGFLLLLLGADPNTGYTEWAYRNLDRVMEPFRGIFQPVEITGDAILDTSILFAMVIYGILLLLTRAFLDWLTIRLHRAERQHDLDQAASRAATASDAAVQYHLQVAAAQQAANEQATLRARAEAAQAEAQAAAQAPPAEATSTDPQNPQQPPPPPPS